MCRYGYKTYKPHFACFNCRKVFKKSNISDYLKQKGLLDAYQRLILVQRDAKKRRTVEERYGVTLVELEEQYTRQISKCPQCGDRMANLGFDFRAPKQKDVKAWQIIQRMYELGHVFLTCGCHGFGYVPKDKAEYVKYLQERLQEYNARFRLAVDGKGIDRLDREDAVSYWNERINLIEKELDKVTKSRRAK